MKKIDTEILTYFIREKIELLLSNTENTEFREYKSRRANCLLQILEYTEEATGIQMKMLYEYLKYIDSKYTLKTINVEKNGEEEISVCREQEPLYTGSREDLIIDFIYKDAEDNSISISIKVIRHWGIYSYGRHITFDIYYKGKGYYWDVDYYRTLDKKYSDNLNILNLYEKDSYEYVKFENEINKRVTIYEEDYEIYDFPPSSIKDICKHIEL